jgi:hypothetical protein
MTFKQLVVSFLRSIGGTITAITLCTVWFRVWCFDFGMKDLYIVPSVVLAWIPLEYFFHRYLMHEWIFTPFRHSHDKHHDKPCTETGLPDIWVVVMYCLISLGLLFTTGGIYTGWATLLSMLLWYEFAHYACHTSYKSKTWWGYAILSNHLQHHMDRPHRYALLFPIFKVKS